MPGGDGTGPGGMGPMTGRAAGFCAGYPVPGYANPVGGRGYWGWGRGGGFGRGRGSGRGFGRGRAGYGWPTWGGYAGSYGGYPVAAPSPEQEQETLRQQAQYLQQSLDAISKRIEDLDKEKSP